MQLAQQVPETLSDSSPTELNLSLASQNCSFQRVADLMKALERTADIIALQTNRLGFEASSVSLKPNFANLTDAIEWSHDIVSRNLAVLQSTQRGFAKIAKTSKHQDALAMTVETQISKITDEFLNAKLILDRMRTDAGMISQHLTPNAVSEQVDHNLTRLERWVHKLEIAIECVDFEVAVLAEKIKPNSDSTKKHLTPFAFPNPTDKHEPDYASTKWFLYFTPNVLDEIDSNSQMYIGKLDSEDIPFLERVRAPASQLRQLRDDYNVLMVSFDNARVGVKPKDYSFKAYVFLERDGDYEINPQYLGYTLQIDTEIQEQGNQYWSYQYQQQYCANASVTYTAQTLDSKNQSPRPSYKIDFVLNEPWLFFLKFATGEKISSKHQVPKTILGAFNTTHCGKYAIRLMSQKKNTY